MRQGNRTKVTTPAPCGDLWDLVLDMDWTAVVEHCQNAPQDAQWQDGHWHETPLYLACQQSPTVEAVKAIIEAHPEAPLVPSRANHDLPLHIACRYQSPVDVLEALLQSYPVTAIEQTRWGRRCVFSISLTRVLVSCLRNLLCILLSVTHQRLDSFAVFSPLMALWEFRAKEPSLLEEEQLWEKINLLLLAVAKFREDPQFSNQQPSTRTKQFRSPPLHTGTVTDMRLRDNDSNPLVVHATVSLGALSCPIEVLRYVLKRWPEQVTMKDECGQVPLHIAVGPTSWSSATKRKYKPREQQFLELLLQAHPAAAMAKMASDHRRYPLHSAIANRHSWHGGVKELFYAASHVLLVQDPVTKLYPFQLAAIPVRDTAVELDTIYHLLREKPDVLNLFDLQKRDRTEEETVQQRTPYDVAATQYQRCSRMLDNALVGTISAILIGSVAGIMFGD